MSESEELSPATRYALARRRQDHRGTRFGEFEAGLGFEPDEFQRRAGAALEAGRSVLVAAPTGAGKTVVAEFAVRLAQIQGQRAFYTTPIKALSNQKYHELVRSYGSERVGLLTGDVTINGDAEIVVMTTEVLRNMIYEGSSRLASLGYVVLDEVHYLADRFRGPVWEEVIIMLPDHVRLVSLSATVSNAEEFGAWLAEVRGETEVIVSEHRPVPLYHHMMVGPRVLDMFGADGGLNPALKRFSPRPGEHRAPGHRRRRGGPQRNGRPPSHLPRPASRLQVIDELDRSGLLPAITFIFSRAGCDAAVTQCLTTGLVLTSAEERRRIQQRLDELEASIDDRDLGVLGFATFGQGLLAGFAAHHAGMLPQFKQLVEELFQAGMVRMVFATETLALGINMPARTVVLEKLVKFNGEAHVSITPGEFTQLTGRAGRRGIDVEGHAVIVWSPQIDPVEAAGLAVKRSYRLVSSFRPTYNMAANLATRLSDEEAETVLETSFAQFQADRSVVGIARRVRKNEEALEAYAGNMACERGDFAEYLALRRAASQAEKKAKKGRAKLAERQLTDGLMALRIGDVIDVPHGKRAGLCVILEPARLGRTSFVPPTALGADGRIRQLREHEFAAPPETLGRIKVPKRFDAGQTKARRDLAASLRAAAHDGRLAVPERPAAAPRARAQDDQLSELRRKIAAHPCHACPERERHARWGDRWWTLRGETDGLIRQIEGRTSSIATVFRRVRGVLEVLGFLPDHPDELTRIYGERDLLTALSVREGVWRGLTPADAAALASTLVYQPRRDDALVPDQLPSAALDSALGRVFRLWGELEDLEEEHRLPRTPRPETGLLWPMHRWAQGRSLDSVLRRSDLAAGDFVRWAKQTVDLLDQIAQVAPAKERDVLVRAIDAVRRGVVLG